MHTTYLHTAYSISTKPKKFYKKILTKERLIAKWSYIPSIYLQTYIHIPHTYVRTLNMKKLYL